MFVFRGLFWLALVALLIPRGPDLGIDLGHAKGLSAVQSELRNKALKPLLDAGDAHVATDDPIEAYRRAAFRRLALVRKEIAADRARRGKAAELSAIIPEAWRD